MGQKNKGARRLRGQLMLQLSAGRFFRPGVELHERTHRRVFYTNAWLLDPDRLELPVGTVTASNAMDDITAVMIEATDRLETIRWDGTHEVIAATGGDDLVDDVAYVLSFVCNRTFDRDHDRVRRLVRPAETRRRGRRGADLFPDLFEPGQVVAEGDLDDARRFIESLLSMSREDFARVMRVIRSSVDATRRAMDDPTGAYTDLVASLEALADDALSSPTTWERYDSRKRKIFDGALEGADAEVTERLRAAVLEADRAGLRRRFTSSTIARIAPSYYRSEAAGCIRPPRTAEMARILDIAYDIRSRKSHVLADLGEEAWVFADGAETAFEPNLERVLTLAGLWRLVRHVVRRFVADAPAVEPEPWDYRDALPGIVTMQVAPQYWVWEPSGLDATTALRRFEGVLESVIGGLAGGVVEPIDLSGLVEKIEELVPKLQSGDARTALIGIYALWHATTGPELHRPQAQAFLDSYSGALDDPSPISFATHLLSRRDMPAWTTDQWADMALRRHARRVRGKEHPLPPQVDVLLQLVAADYLEEGGRHDEAIVLAANAVGEAPGHSALIAWEERLLSGDHDPDFPVYDFLEGVASVEPEE